RVPQYHPPTISLFISSFDFAIFYFLCLKCMSKVAHAIPIGNPVLAVFKSVYLQTRMKYDTYIPCDILKPFIRSFAIQETAEATTYKVLPDTGVVIGFQYKGRLARVEDGNEKPLAIYGISGLADQSRTFKNSPHIGSILVF